MNPEHQANLSRTLNYWISAYDQSERKQKAMQVELDDLKLRDSKCKRHSDFTDQLGVEYNYWIKKYESAGCKHCKPDDKDDKKKDKK